MVKNEKAIEELLKGMLLFMKMLLTVLIASVALIGNVNTDMIN